MNVLKNICILMVALSLVSCSKLKGNKKNKSEDTTTSQAEIEKLQAGHLEETKALKAQLEALRKNPQEKIVVQTDEAALENLRKEKQTEIDGLKTNVTSLNSQIASLKKSLEEAGTPSEADLQKLKDLEDNLKKAKADLAAKTTEYQTLETQNAAWLEAFSLKKNIDDKMQIFFDYIIPGFPKDSLAKCIKIDTDNNEVKLSAIKQSKELLEEIYTEVEAFNSHLDKLKGTPAYAALKQISKTSNQLLVHAIHEDNNDCLKFFGNDYYHYVPDLLYRVASIDPQRAFCDESRGPENLTFTFVKHNGTPLTPEEVDKGLVYNGYAKVTEEEIEAIEGSFDENQKIEVENVVPNLAMSIMYDYKACENPGSGWRVKMYDLRYDISLCAASKGTERVIELPDNFCDEL